jgi:hypothetical protein
MTALPATFDELTAAISRRCGIELLCEFGVPEAQAVQAVAEVLAKHGII